MPCARCTGRTRRQLSREEGRYSPFAFRSSPAACCHPDRGRRGGSNNLEKNPMSGSRCHTARDPVLLSAAVDQCSKLGASVRGHGEAISHGDSISRSICDVPGNLGGRAYIMFGLIPSSGLGSGKREVCSIRTEQRRFPRPASKRPSTQLIRRVIDFEKLDLGVRQSVAKQHPVRTILSRIVI